MAIDVTPTPGWLTHLESAIEPARRRILDLPVVSFASKNGLDPRAIRNFMIEFYPIIRDFPMWLETLLERSPRDGEAFFRDNLRVERQHAAMWQAMGEGFGVARERFAKRERSNEAVEKFHSFLTEIGQKGSFASAVAATNYAVEGVAHDISVKALEGLQHNSALGQRGRWWLEEHATYDDDHPVMAMEVIKSCVARGEDTPESVEKATLRSLDLMYHAMDTSYHS